jgi:hypothetical protein
MAEKRKRAKKYIGGRHSGLTTKPVVEILQCTIDHLQWLSWLGGNFPPGTCIPLPELSGVEPPEPGSCGIETEDLTVADLVGLVNTAQREVAHVVGRLQGKLPPVPGGHGQMVKTAGVRSLRRRSRR